jgi:hypothetical protein
VSILDSARSVRGLVNRARDPSEWGNLRRLHPFSDSYGLDRGGSVDRIYIDGFIKRNEEAIRGRVVEVRDDHYASHAKARIDRLDIVDIDASNPRATLVIDLGVAGSLPAATYDCAIVTQTLHLVQAIDTAVENIWRSLAPGGTALLSMPVLCRLDGDAGPSGDLWRFTPAGWERYLRTRLPADARTAVEGYGNLVVAIAFLSGIAPQELDPEELAFQDPHFPVVACARIDRPA